MRKSKKSSNKHAPQARSGLSIPSAELLRALAGVTIIVVVAFIAYYPSLIGGFILDDNLLLTENNLIKASDGLYRLWFTTEPFDYWPVTNTTLWIEWRFWGMNPTGYHVTNLILHIVETLLIWIILRKLSIPGAFLAAIIFAVHPVNVESVAWIAQRKGLMAMLFFLLSILWYLKSEMGSAVRCHGGPWERGKNVWYWLSLAAFLLAMLSKGSVAVLPVLLLGIVWWMRPLTRWDLLRAVPFFVVGLALVVVNVWFRTHGSEDVFRTVSLVERLLGAGGVIWFYLYKAFLPFDLVFIYPQWRIETGNLLWWPPLFAAVVVTAVLWWYRKGWSRPFLFAWGFFCVALAPVMGFIDVGFMYFSMVADHYQHIAIIGVIALVTAGWSAWYQHSRDAVHTAAAVVAVMAVGAFTFLTWRQCEIYHDATTLYQVTLKKDPNSWFTHNLMGLVLTDKGQLSEAIEHYEQALRLKPDYPQAHNNLGVTLNYAGRQQEAIGQFQEAIRLKPKYAPAQNNLGDTLIQVGRLPEAIEHLHQALQINPNYPEAYVNLGNALAKSGQPHEAIKEYHEALRLKGDIPEAHNFLGMALESIGQDQQAIEQYKRALELKPDYNYAYKNLTFVYVKMHLPSEAIATAQKALDVARSKGRTEMVKQIEDWLNSHTASQSDIPNKLPPTKSDLPSP